MEATIMENFLNLLKELDNHNYKTQETVIITMKAAGKVHHQEIMKKLQENPNLTENQYQSWLKKRMNEQKEN